MGTTTIRVSEKAHQTLNLLSREAGMPITELVERAVEQYRRQRLLDAANAAYAEVRRDSKAWAALQAERDEWDGTIADGLGEQ